MKSVLCYMVLPHHIFLSFSYPPHSYPFLSHPVFSRFHTFIEYGKLLFTLVSMMDRVHLQ